MEFIGKCLVFLLAFVYTVQGQNTPVITEDIIEEAKAAGQPAHLICKVKLPTVTLNGVQVKWSKVLPDMDATISTNEKIVTWAEAVEGGLPKYVIKKQESGDTTMYILTINKLAINDNGRYRCWITWHGYTDPVQKYVNVRVQLPPDIREDSSNSLTINQFEDVVLVCYVTGEPRPTVIWTAGANNQVPQDGVQVDNFNTSTNVLTSKLILTKVTTADAGVYRCNAQNNVLPNAIHLIQLNVKYASTVWRVKPNFQAVLGQDAYVECYGRGEPKPEMKWYYWGTSMDNIPDDPQKWKSRQRLTEGAKYNLQVSNNQEAKLNGTPVTANYYKLKIKTVDANDIGFYGCLGENTLGYGKDLVQLYQTDCTGVNCGTGGSIRDKIYETIGGAPDCQQVSVLTLLACLLMSVFWRFFRS